MNRYIVSENLPSIHWESGDYTWVLATKLSLEELSVRFKIEIFRDKDDLDWLDGAVYVNDAVGPILIMRHDNNPEKLTIFYVDSGQGIVNARVEIAKIFNLKDLDIAYVRSWSVMQNSSYRTVGRRSRGLAQASALTRIGRLMSIR